MLRFRSSCVAAMVLVGCLPESRDPVADVPEPGEEPTVETEAPKPDEDPVMVAVAVIRDTDLEEAMLSGHSVAEIRELSRNVVEAISFCGRAADPRALPALLDAISFTPVSERHGGKEHFSAEYPPAYEMFPARPVLIEFGEAAVPHIVSALVEDATKPRKSEREYSLLSALAAILGPFDGVKRLEKEIDDAAVQETADLLVLVLYKFCFFRYVGSWMPEGEEDKQAFTGNVYKELDKRGELRRVFSEYPLTPLYRRRLGPIPSVSGTGTD